MARVEQESYETRTVAPDENMEKVPIEDNEEDPAVSNYQNQGTVNDGTGHGLQYGMPAAYAQREEDYNNGYDQNGTNNYGATFSAAGAPPIVSSNEDPEAPLSKQKRVLDAYVLGIGLGFFGAHHFYLKRYGFGTAYFLTFGFLGCGYLADLFRMPVLVNRYNKVRAKGKIDNLKHLDDAYVCWFPFGLFGAHHFYLGRKGWGILYLCTLGLLGIGWLIDGFYLPRLVKNINKERALQKTVMVKDEKTLYIAWLFAIFPFSGLLGVHHYYLGNYIFGFFYTLTLGNLGIGYITDWFKTPLLVKRSKLYNACGIGMPKRAFLDEAYLLAFPLGFLGLHNFYLKRYGWGVLYFFTIGCFGIGWLLDLIRMPCLVRDYNKMVDEKSLQDLPSSPEEGIVNPAAIPDPVAQQEKALEGASADGAIGGIFTTNLQQNYPYSNYGYTDQLPANAYIPPTTPYFNPTMVDPANPYQPPPGVQPPHYGAQDGLPSYNDAVSEGTIDSSLVSSQGGPPSMNFPSSQQPPKA